MNCKNCGKEFEPPKGKFEIGGKVNRYSTVCSSYCYAVVHKKFGSYAYKRGPK